jgi:hypothetical protein
MARLREARSQLAQWRMSANAAKRTFVASRSRALEGEKL